MGRKEEMGNPTYLFAVEKSKPHKKKIIIIIMIKKNKDRGAFILSVSKRILVISQGLNALIN